MAPPYTSKEVSQSKLRSLVSPAQSLVHLQRALGVGSRFQKKKTDHPENLEGGLYTGFLFDPQLMNLQYS